MFDSEMSADSEFGSALAGLLRAIMTHEDRYEKEGFEDLQMVSSPENYPKGMVVVKDQYGSEAHVPFAFCMTAVVHMQVAKEVWNVDEDFLLEDVIRGGQSVEFAPDATVTSQMSHFKSGDGQFTFFVVDEGEATELVTIYASEYEQFISEVLAVQGLEETWRVEALAEKRLEGGEIPEGSDMTYDELSSQYRYNLIREIDKSRSLKRMMKMVSEFGETGESPEDHDDSYDATSALSQLLFELL